MKWTTTGSEIMEKMITMHGILLTCLIISCLVVCHLRTVHAMSNENTTREAPQNMPTEKDLVARLLSSYGDTSVRPVRNYSQPVEVFFRMLLYELIKLAYAWFVHGHVENGARIQAILNGSFFKAFEMEDYGRIQDETRQIVTVRTNMRLQWIDEYLQWDPEEYGGIYNLTLKMHQVWRPDVVLDENMDRNFISLPEDETFVVVQHDGAMDWLFPAITTSACKMNIEYYPFDSQECVLTFYPWTLDESKMRFFAKNDEDAFQARYVKNGVWSLDNFSATNRSIKYLCCPYPNDHIEYRLKFKREPGFFLTNVVVPAIFLTVLMLIGFWLHPDSGEKVTFTVTNLLALTLFQQLVADNMPPIGEPRSILVTCFFMLIILSGCAVSLSVLVLRMYHHDTNSKPPPWAIKFLMPWFSRIGARSYIKKLYTINKIEVAANEEKVINGNSSTNIMTTDMKNKDVRQSGIDSETRETNQFIWRQVALAFDSCCGTFLSCAMVGTLLYALISFLK